MQVSGSAQALFSDNIEHVMNRKRMVRIAAQCLILVVVAIGILTTATKARQQLNAMREQLNDQAQQAHLEAANQADPERRRSETVRAEALSRMVDRFWVASPWHLLAAGVFCAVGMFPTSWFWRQALLEMGQPVPRLAGHWAYFYGGLGKYFPGKAMVIVIRLAQLNPFGVKKIVATVTIFLETLTMMAVGGAVAAISLLLLNLDWRLTLLSLGLLIATFLPTLPAVLKTSIARLQPGVPKETLNQWTSRIHFGLIGKGWAAASITWSAYGLSLWCILQGLAIADASSQPWHVILLSSLGACALAVVLGFVSMVPGGAGVREVVLSTILTPVVGPAAALCSAIWLRVTWLAAELSIVGILWVLKQIARPAAVAIRE